MMTQESVLARYRILHELGRGAIGAVYAARDREGATVALKRLDPALSSKSDANLADRFLKQASSAQLLKHRNIVKIHDAGKVAGTVYVAMEMLEGESLRKILDAGPLPMARALRIAHDIACGLAHAHLQGVVHEGLKPSNVIVLRSGVVKITDFGIGQLGQAALPPGAQAGCLSYMAPEQLRGGPVDHRCDIFALGALFYEMLTHRPPFEGSSPKELMENILRAKPPRPSELNPHVPRALDAIVLGMLAAAPVARMPGAPIVLRDLQRVEESLGLGSGASPGEPTPSVLPAGPEPRPRTPHSYGEGREASGVRIRADSSPAADFQHRTEGLGLRSGASVATEEPTASVPPAGPEPRLRTSDPDRFRAASSAEDEFQRRDRMIDREAFDYNKAVVMRERESRRERSSGSRSAMFATLAFVLAVLGGGAAGFMYYSPSASQRDIAASRMQEGPPPAQAESLIARASGQPAPEASSPMPPKPPAAEPGPPAQTESVVARAPEPPAPAAPAPAQELPPPTQPTAKAPKQRPGGMAQVIVAVSPRGEIYIDGKHHGTTPPVTTLNLEPGMHRIEVRSGSRQPYLTYMTVQAGDVRRIRHDFNASRVVPVKSASSKAL